jgi:hypothetical protein
MRDTISLKAALLVLKPNSATMAGVPRISQLTAVQRIPFESV